MFQLHDKTRRRACIFAFVALGALPALLVGGWCASRHGSGCVRDEAERLGRRLGLGVKLVGVKYLRPGAMLYERLEAADPETGRTLFRCRLLELARSESSDSQGKRRPTLTLSLSQPEVDAGSLDRLWQCLQRTLEESCGPLEADVRISAGELTLRAAENSQTLTAVNGAMEKLPGGTHAWLDFRLAGVDTPEPAHVRVVRNRQVSPPASGFELYTGGGELPCSVLSMGLAELKPLGRRCRFRGYIWANETSDGWHGEVTGQLTDLDLGRLVSDYFPHRLTGVGAVTIQSARFRRGRLEEGSVIVTAGPGAIDRSLLTAAVERLGLVAAAEPLPDGDSVPYRQLAFSATLDAEGLRLQGRCTAAKPGTILSDGRCCLLGEPSQPAPAVALVRTLVPESAVQVPASRQTDWLLHHLPLPEVMPPSGVPSHARVRLHEPAQR